MNAIKRYVPLAAALLLSACVTVPTGPSVVAARQQQDLWSFRPRAFACQRLRQSVGGTASRRTTGGVERSPARRSALLRARSSDRHPATRDQRGDQRGTSLLFGSAASNYYYGGYYEVQRRYDGAYMQCMYAKGNQIPVRGPAPVHYHAPPPAYYGPPAG